MNITRRRAGVALALPAAGVLAIAATAGSSANDGASTAQSVSPGVRGEFSLIQMVHTTSSSFGNLANVNAWDGTRDDDQVFRYRGIPCTGNAPVNNIASDLPSYGTRVRGSRAPSSMRAHPFSFRVRKTKSGAWRMVGAIKFTVCKLGPGPTPSNETVADVDKPKILVGFSAKFRRESAQVVRWSGRFRIENGTGRYDDLRGSGNIAGYFFCFAPEGCTALGRKYVDGQFVMDGFYRDPTPNLASG